MCQKRKQSLWSGRILIASLASQWQGVSSLCVYDLMTILNNFTSNFLTYRTCSSWHQDIFESGKLGTDSVVSYQRHNFRCPYRNRPYLSLHSAWKTRYTRHMCTRHSAFRMKYLHILCTAPLAFVRRFLASSARSFRDPCRDRLKSLTVKTRKSENRSMSFSRR